MYRVDEAETLKQRQTFEEDAEESELEETFVAESEVVGDESQDPAPDTLDELMEEASRRSEEEVTPEEDTLELPPAVKEDLVPQICQISLLYVTGWQMWGVLGVCPICPPEEKGENQSFQTGRDDAAGETLSLIHI